MPDLMRPMPTPPTLYPQAFPRGNADTARGREGPGVAPSEKASSCPLLSVGQRCVNQTADFGEGGGRRPTGGEERHRIRGNCSLITGVCAAPSGAPRHLPRSRGRIRTTLLHIRYTCPDFCPSYAILLQALVLTHDPVRKVCSFSRSCSSRSASTPRHPRRTGSKDSRSRASARGPDTPGCRRHCRRRRGRPA